MKTTRFRDLNHKASTEQLAAARRELDRSLTLAEIRKARELTQKQLADALETTQPGISAIEKRTDLYVSTMRSYIEALGGRLELTAIFKDGPVSIRTFGELDDLEAELHEAAVSRQR